MTTVPRIITSTTVTVHYQGEVLVANSSNPAFAEIRQAALNQDWETVRSLVNLRSAVTKWSKGKFSVEGDQLLYDGRPVPPVLGDRVIAFIQEGAPVEHLLAFYERLKLNPSFRSIEQLYKFLEHRNIPIGEDGCFYAYKAVNRDWWSYGVDRRTGRAELNKIGMSPTMPRSEVDDDPTHGCSYGFHVGSLEYAATFGSADRRLLICKVDPANVVSVPHDCAFQKLRCSSYTVIQEYTGPLPDVFWSGVSTQVDDWESPSTVSKERRALEKEEARLDEEMTELDNQISRLETALSAAEDADSPESHIAYYVNQISTLEAAMNALELRAEQVRNEILDLDEDQLDEY